MTVYRTPSPDDDVADLLKEARQTYRPDLDQADVTISVLFADECSHHGYAAAAVIQINSVKNRVNGMADCTLTIDETWWADHNRVKQIGLLHHELVHILIVRDKAGGVKTDAAGRPKLKQRKHDFVQGGFWEVAQQHGENSPEAEVYAPIQKKFRQLLLWEQS